jgi:hypothetical protein
MVDEPVECPPGSPERVEPSQERRAIAEDDVEQMVRRKIQSQEPAIPQRFSF